LVGGDCCSANVRGEIPGNNEEDVYMTSNEDLDSSTDEEEEKSTEADVHRSWNTAVRSGCQQKGMRQILGRHVKTT